MAYILLKSHYKLYIILLQFLLRMTNSFLKIFLPPCISFLVHIIASGRLDFHLMPHSSCLKDFFENFLMFIQVCWLVILSALWSLKKKGLSFAFIFKGILAEYRNSGLQLLPELALLYSKLNCLWWWYRGGPCGAPGHKDFLCPPHSLVIGNWLPAACTAFPKVQGADSSRCCLGKGGDVSQWRNSQEKPQLHLGARSWFPLKRCT